MDVHCLVQRVGKLSDQTAKISLQQPLVQGNSFAHCLLFEAFDDDFRPADLTGVSVAGQFLRSDGKTVAPIFGEISGSAARLILPPSCYTIPGPFQCTMDLIGPNGAVRTVLWVEGMVEKRASDEAVDPGTPVPSITQAIGEATAAAAAASSAAADASAAAQNAWSAAASAVRYDTEQSLTNAQKATARGNIGAAGEAAMQTMQDEVDTHLLQLRRAAVIEKALVKNWVNGMLGSDTGVPTTGWNTRGIYTPDYYLVSPGMEIRFTGNKTGKGGETLNHYAYFYDAEKNMIGVRNSKTPYNIPENAYYARFGYAFAPSSGQTLDGYGGIDAVVAEWNVESVSAIEKAMQGGGENE